MDERRDPLQHLLLAVKAPKGTVRLGPAALPLAPARGAPLRAWQLRRSHVGSAHSPGTKTGALSAAAERLELLAALGRLGVLALLFRLAGGTNSLAPTLAARLEAACCDMSQPSWPL